jgi:hypothetical protein
MNQNNWTNELKWLLKWRKPRLALVTVLLAAVPTAVLAQTPTSAEKSQPAKPPNTPTQWVECAAQEGHCVFEGKRLVRFGADTRWVEREFDGTVHCTSTAFGTNPARGALKICQIQGSAAPPPPPAPVLPKGDGTAVLRWTPPTQAMDGRPLKQLGGYRIRYGIKPDALTETIQVPGAKVTSYIVRDLGKGVWYFAVVAYETGGYESEISNVVTKTIE